MTHILIIGSATKDLIKLPGGKAFMAPGGKAYYYGITLAALGERATVITRYATGDSYLFERLTHNPRLKVYTHLSCGTLTFKHVYRTLDTRISRSSNNNYLFNYKHIKQTGKIRRYSAALIAAQNPYEIPLRIVKHIQNGLKAADLEHFLHDYTTKLYRLSAKKLNNLLSELNIIQISDQDMSYLPSKPKTVKDTIKLLRQNYKGIILITHGTHGVTICDQATRAAKTIEPFRARKPIVDTTGAGDIFLASFLSQYVQSKKAFAAAKFAAKITTEFITAEGRQKIFMPS